MTASSRLLRLENLRKFTGFLLVMVLAFVALLLGEIEGATYADIVKYGIWAYMIGNVGEHFAKRTELKQ